MNRNISRLMMKLGLLVLVLLSVGTVSAASKGSGDVVVLKNEGSVLPIGDLSDAKIALISIGQPKNNVFRDYCKFYSKVDFHKIDLNTSIDKELASVSDNTACLVAVYSFQPWAIEAFSKVVSKYSSVAIFFILDKNVSKFSQSETSPSAIILARDASYTSQVRAAEAVFGGRDVNAKLKNDISGLAKKGEGFILSKTRLGFSTPTQEGFSSDLKSRIDSIVKFNIKKQSFPGCQILVARNGNIVINEAYGRLTYDAKSKLVNRETLYDIASMTKATATIAGLMSAYDEGLYELDDQVSKHIVSLQGTDKEEITVSQLMFHESGMPSTLNTYALMVDSTTFSGKLMSYKQKSPYTIKLDRGVYGNNTARRRTDVMHTKPSYGYEIEIARGIYGGDKMKAVISDAIYNSTLKEKKYLYSCLNFCMLKDMEEVLTGEPHEQYVHDYVFAPIGAWHTMFNPAIKGYKVNVAPTERDNFMRKQLLQGYVHDEIAAYSGGVQGNAGLFSTAEDIAKLCQTWLNKGYYGDISVFSEQTVKLFTTQVSETANRGLGFDRASRVKALQDINMPDSVFGHTGFTGTCFWIDPENDIIVVFLCNRIYPSRDNASFRKYGPRTEIIRAIYESLKK